MIAILILFLFLASGVYIANKLLSGIGIIERSWIGLCLGFAMLMLFPAAMAFIFSFTVMAHVFAIVLDIIVVFLVYKFKRNEHISSFSVDERKKLLNALILVLPFSVLMAYLQYTHTIMSKNGALWVGQSTYGDLPLHLSIITSAIGAKFPMDYSIFPGVRLGYPFLIDTLSSTLYLFGLSLQSSIIIPGTIISSCIFLGYYLLALKICNDKRAAALAFILLFLNGGLGFLYDIDLAGGNFSARINEIMTGYYKTPVNRPEAHNLVWANIIADMMLPQRTFMGGMLMFLPSIYLIITPLFENREFKKGELALLIALASSLPMINTHAFLALGIFSIIQMISRIIIVHASRKKTVFIQFAIFGAATLCLTLPQLFTWTFGQSLHNSGFLRLHFNWINNNNGTLRDIYPVFYLKNMGIVIIPMLMSIFTKDKKFRSLILSALVIFLLAEFMLFQPNKYDNNKLIYFSFLIMLLPTSSILISIYDSLVKIPARALLAALFIFTCVISGSLSLARECVSGYEAFSPDSVDIANFVENNTDRDSVFITASNHLNPISSLAGRKILCGPDLWLYYHGIDTSKRKAEIKDFYTNPSKHNGLIEKYNVKYIIIGPGELYEYSDIDLEKLDDEFDIVYSNNSYTLYKVI